MNPVQYANSKNTSLTPEERNIYTIKPVAPKERILFLDVLRGLAIFGMFTVNMTADLPWGESFREQSLSSADRTVMILVDLLTNGKFITIFSFLFGVGFVIQLERANQNDARFFTIYFRRLFGLFVIACVAILAGLGAHILIDYSIYGLLLPLFYKRSKRFLLMAVIVCFTISTISGTMAELNDLAESQSVVEVQPTDDDKIRLSEDTENTERVRIFQEGSFKEIAMFRAPELLRYVGSWKQRLWDMDILGLMLLGCYVCRRNAIQDAKERGRLARATIPWLLSIGATSMIISVGLDYFLAADLLTPIIAVMKDITFWPFGAPLLGLGYAAGLERILERDFWKRALTPLAAVGRLALTNYLIHSAIIAAFTYKWGLGLYGEMGPFSGLMVVLIAFPLMVASSSWWLTRFRFGPFEWLWRTISYGKLPPA